MQLPQTLLARHGRPVGVAATMWLFGLATTVVLLALWGRAIVSDQASLTESASTVVASGFVEDRVALWLGEALAGTTGLGDERAAEAARRIAADPAVAAVVDDLARDLVAGALDPGASEVRIDPDEVLRPVVPVLVATLADEGVAVDSSALLSSAAASPDVVLAAGALEQTSSAVADSRTAMSIAVVVGVAVMVVAGGAAVLLADDRRRQLRVLGTRVLVSGLTFAVLLRLGAWAVDPSGGRSPVADLLTAQLRVPLVVAALGALLGAIAWSRRTPTPEPVPESEQRAFAEV